MKKENVVIFVVSIVALGLAIIWSITSKFDIEPLVVTVATLLSLLATVFEFFKFSGGEDKEGKAISYEEKIKPLISNLQKYSAEIDSTFKEISILSEDKTQKIKELEITLTTLSGKETELKEKIATLEKVPIEVIRHFEEVLNKGDKRSAYRDYILFGAGVIVSAIISIILKKIGYG